ncbi:N,N-dimethylformamidase beta subunit family domain-containing protein [Acinetobacter bereziniae]|uniref:N,N-dimethylformamidase beta subunit family domain-containing protein n=1 Tax=Acinetobacter bereziniae TaxID=106648 RepID=UPI002FD9AA53
MQFRAYFEEWSVAPGDTVRLAVSTDYPEVSASLERVTAGPGAKDQRLVQTVPYHDVLNTTFKGQSYATKVGSWAELYLPEHIQQNLSIHCWIWPTVPEKEAAQVIWSLSDGAGHVTLKIENNILKLLHNDDLILSINQVFVAKCWYSITVDLDEKETAILIKQVDGYHINGEVSQSAQYGVHFLPQKMFLSTLPTDTVDYPRQCFNGKIGNPSIAEIRAAKKLPFIGWDFSGNWNNERLTVITANAEDGKLFNGAERAVTGYNWDGRCEVFHHAPEMYAAIQFHDDAVLDSDWPYDLEFILPKDIKSGIYLVKLVADHLVDYIPLFIRAELTESAAALFIVPTNTYLAYANDHLATFDFSKVMAHHMVVPDDERVLFEDTTFGRSLYDVHSDGTPVRQSSRRRPLVNIRPNYFSWLNDSYRHFTLDLYIIEWLEKNNIDYHIATDEQLEQYESQLLNHYQVVISGSHPEYWTENALDSLTDFIKHNGKFMYLGGNGFYWVTSRHPHKPWIIEVRRDNSGTRCWNAPIGERSHPTTGELGGIWKSRGKTPHKTVGIGFAAQGWGKAVGYKRNPVSYSGKGSAFFRNVSAQDIGLEGFVLGGAVGDEVDRFDIALGSPAYAEVLATSYPVGVEYQLVIEDQVLTMPDQDGAHLPDQIKADMVYFEVEGGGEVFAIGSIVYAGAMAWNNFDNDLARVTTNVLIDFISRGKKLE